MINLHIFNFLCNNQPNPNSRFKDKTDKVREKQLQDLQNLNIAHFQEHLKFISEYVSRSIKDMAKTKFILPPVAYRVLKSRLEDEDFLRF